MDKHTILRDEDLLREALVESLETVSREDLVSKLSSYYAHCMTVGEDVGTYKNDDDDLIDALVSDGHDLIKEL